MNIKVFYKILGDINKENDGVEHFWKKFNNESLELLDKDGLNSKLFGKPIVIHPNVVGGGSRSVFEVDYNNASLICKFSDKKEAVYSRFLTQYPHMIKSFDIIKCDRNIYMILYEKAYCNMYDIKKKYAQKACNVEFELLNGIKTFISSNLLHGDLILENLFLTDNGVVYGDFGNIIMTGINETDLNNKKYSEFIAGNSENYENTYEDEDEDSAKEIELNLVDRKIKEIITKIGSMNIKCGNEFGKRKSRLKLKKSRKSRKIRKSKRKSRKIRKSKRKSRYN